MTVMDDRFLDRVVVAKYGTGDEAFRGRVVSYADRPTYSIQTEEGRTTSWIAGLCRPATREEGVQYWRDRAEAAEQELQEVRRWAMTTNEGDEDGG